MYNNIRRQIKSSFCIKMFVFSMRNVNSKLD
nr:MAG TPA: hypothetical protein [Caudoviricetes sp.]